MTWFDPCHGEGFRQCIHCRRNIDNEPLSIAGEHQNWHKPHVKLGFCADWIAQPKEKREPA